MCAVRKKDSRRPFESRPHGDCLSGLQGIAGNAISLKYREISIMEESQVMNQKMEALIHHVERISAIVNSVQQQLAQLHVKCSEKDTFLTMKEELSEVHTRLEGVREFVAACRRQVTGTTDGSEEIEIWL